MDARQEECQCIPGSADLFTKPLVQSAVTERTTVECFPVADVGDGPLEFFVPASDDGYYNLRDHRLEVKIRVRKYDDNGAAVDLVAADKVSLVNFALHSLFQQLDVYVNENLISIASDTYAYRAYIENMLCYSKEHKKTQLATELYARDTAGKMSDLTGVEATGNKGFVKRGESIAKSSTVTLRGMLHNGFLRQDRYLLNGCSLRIKLTPHAQSFPLLAADAFKARLEIISARFELPKLTLNPTLMLEHAKEIEKQPALYPYRRAEIKTFSIPTGSMQVVKEGLFSGQIPRRLVLGFVTAEAYGGKQSLNPYDFIHAKCNYLCCFVDGVRHPSRAMSPNFDTGDYAEVYDHMIRGSGLYDEDTTLDIGYDEFKDGYAFFVITLTPGEPDSMANDPRRNGSVRVEVKFKTALTKTLICLCYAEFDSLLEIDRDRNIIKDY